MKRDDCARGNRGFCEARDGNRDGVDAGHRGRRRITAARRNRTRRSCCAGRQRHGPGHGRVRAASDISRELVVSAQMNLDGSWRYCNRGLSPCWRKHKYACQDTLQYSHPATPPVRQIRHRSILLLDKRSTSARSRFVRQGDPQRSRGIGRSVHEMRAGAALWAGPRPTAHRRPTCILSGWAGSQQMSGVAFSSRKPLQTARAR